MNSEQMRELDAWIAEHVMGWQWMRFNYKRKPEDSGEPFCMLIPPGENWPANPKWNGVKCDGPVEGIPDDSDLSVFQPTTNAATALEVLKKCAEFRESISIYQRLSDDLWVIRTFVDDDDGKRREIFAEAPTLELAIALFAQQLYSRKDA